MTTEEKFKKITDTLLKLLNNNINNRISAELAQGMMTIFYQELKAILNSEEVG